MSSLGRPFVKPLKIIFLINPTKILSEYISVGNDAHLQKYIQQTDNKYQKSNFCPDIIHTSDSVNGMPRLSGRLLCVKDVVDTVLRCDTLQEVTDEYHIPLLQIRQALLYCSGQHCKQDKPEEFCDTCSLRKEQKGPLDVSRLEEITFANTTYVRGDDSLFLGTLDELLDDWNGKNWWEIAADLLIDHRKELFAEDHRHAASGT